MPWFRRKRLDLETVLAEVVPEAVKEAGKTGASAVVPPLAESIAATAALAGVERVGTALAPLAVAGVLAGGAGALAGGLTAAALRLLLDRSRNTADLVEHVVREPFETGMRVARQALQLEPLSDSDATQRGRLIGTAVHQLERAYTYAQPESDERILIRLTQALIAAECNQPAFFLLYSEEVVTGLQGVRARERSRTVAPALHEVERRSSAWAAARRRVEDCLGTDVPGWFEERYTVLTDTYPVFPDPAYLAAEWRRQRADLHAQAVEEAKKCELEYHRAIEAHALAEGLDACSRCARLLSALETRRTLIRAATARSDPDKRTPSR